MALLEWLRTNYKKLETVSGKYLLPQEFKAVLIFIGVGLAAMVYRGGSSVWSAFFPSNTTSEFANITKHNDSLFAALSRAPDTFHFWQPVDSIETDTVKEVRQSKKDIVLAPTSIVLNQASRQDLEKLPGIGEVTSQRIVEYRSSRGKFRSLDELMNVDGIGPKKYERMRPYLRLD